MKKVIILLTISLLLYLLYLLLRPSDMQRTINTLLQQVSYISENSYYNKNLCIINRTDVGFRGYNECMNKNAKFVKTIYYVKDSMVSLVYRCENNNKIGELKMTQHINGGSISCSCNYFDKELHIPIGEATDYGDLIP